MAASDVASLNVEPGGYRPCRARFWSLESGRSETGMALISLSIVRHDPSRGRPCRSRHSGHEMPPTSFEGS